MFRMEMPIHNQDIDAFIPFIKPAQKALPNTFGLQSILNSDNFINNQERSAFAISQGVNLSNENADLRLQLEGLKKELENKKKVEQELKEKLAEEEVMKQAERQKSAALQQQVEVERQARERLEQELKLARESEVRATADRLQAEQALAVNHGANQTMLLQYKTQYEELFTNFRHEQASHQKDNEFWQRQDAHLRKHIRGPVFPMNSGI